MTSSSDPSVDGRLREFFRHLKVQRVNTSLLFLNIQQSVTLVRSSQRLGLHLGRMDSQCVRASVMRNEWCPMFKKNKQTNKRETTYILTIYVDNNLTGVAYNGKSTSKVWLSYSVWKSETRLQHFCPLTFSYWPDSAWAILRGRMSKYCSITVCKFCRKWCKETTSYTCSRQTFWTK